MKVSKVNIHTWAEKRERNVRLFPNLYQGKLNGYLPINKMDKTLFPEAILKLKKKDSKLYKEVKDLKWRYSKHAGCSCGCSPGYVASFKSDKVIEVYLKP